MASDWILIEFRSGSMRFFWVCVFCALDSMRLGAILGKSVHRCDAKTTVSLRMRKSAMRIEEQPTGSVRRQFATDQPVEQRLHLYD